MRRVKEVGAECVYCGKPATCLDHVIPLNRGGSDDDSNLVPACWDCNVSKSNRTPEEWIEGVRANRVTPSDALVDGASRSVRLDGPLWDVLTMIAAEQHRTVNSVIRHIIISHLEVESAAMRREFGESPR